MGVKGDYAKQGVVDASRKDSNVPAHVFAMGIAPKIKTTVNEFTVLHINVCFCIFYIKKTPIIYNQDQIIYLFMGKNRCQNFGYGS